MTPLDWQDMPVRLRQSQEKAQRLQIEVEALRDLILEQAVEIKRLRNALAQSIPIAGGREGTGGLAGGRAA